MNLSLQKKETAADGLRRILRDQLKDAWACLGDDGRLTGGDIHNARKSIKRARATLRLLRPALGATVFDTTNRNLRDVARPLTKVRDAKALLEALAALQVRHGERTGKCPEELRQRLEADRKRSRRGFSASSGRLVRLREALKRQGAEVAVWSVARDEWDLLEPAIRRIYRSARRAYATADDQRTLDALHECRKQVKHLWHSMQILAPLHAPKIGKLADLAHAIADDLGDERDLALLLRYAQSADPPIEVTRDLEALIARRCAQLQDRALAAGARLFRYKPGRFADKLEGWWTAWRRSGRPRSSNRGCR